MNSKGTILAVDDVPESLMTLTDTLTAEGYVVRPADSGELALASVSAAKPELILLDIRMMGMDGFEVCRRLKASAETRDIPLMFLSALTDTAERVEGLKLGAVDFVSKPFQKEELLARIGTHLELSRLRNRLEHMVVERTADLSAANEQLKLELTERLHAEQALRESEERFRSMADNAPVVIWTSNSEGELTFVNRYASTLTGRCVDDLIGHGWMEVVCRHDANRPSPHYLPLVARKREYRTEYRVRRSDGEYRWMLDTATPRLLSDGTFAGYVGIAIDITDLKQSHERFVAAQKLESLGILVSGVAHNFNNLMGAIIAEADLALSELPAGSPVHGNVERIDQIATRAAGIVHLLSAYAGAGPPEELAPIEVTSVVRESLDLIKATVPKSVQFSTDFASKTAYIRADLSRTRQVVMNLLTNAAEALPAQGGSICVSVSFVQVKPSPGTRRGKAPRPGHYVQLRVSDSGCGIPDKDLTRLFDPFYTTKFLGRGLGLAAVQGIVRSLGGTINVQSTVGKGSVFDILLPSMTHDEIVGRPRSWPAEATSPTQLN